MSNDTAEVTVDDDASTATLQPPVAVSPPQTEDGTSPLGSLGPTWIAIFVIVALGISAGIAIWLSSYVVGHDDLAEQQDFDQLQRIVEPLQSLATLMIGTIFGFAIQSGATAANKFKANKNKDEADKQHQQAVENARRATSNAKVAAAQADTAYQLRDAVALMRNHYVPGRDSATKVFVQRPAQPEAEHSHLDLESYIDETLQKANDGRLLKDFRRYL
jgi:hypothetical protein